MQDTIGIVSVDTNHLGVDEDYSKFKTLVEGGDGGSSGGLSAVEPYIEAPPPPLTSTATQVQVSRRLSDDPPPVCLVDGDEVDFIDCADGFVKGTSTTCHQACLDSGGSCCDNGSGGDACDGFTGEFISCVTTYYSIVSFIYHISYYT